MSILTSKQQREKKIAGLKKELAEKNSALKRQEQFLLNGSLTFTLQEVHQSKSRIWAFQKEIRALEKRLGDL